MLVSDFSKANLDSTILLQFIILFQINAFKSIACNDDDSPIYKIHWGKSGVIQNTFWAL